MSAFNGWGGLRLEVPNGAPGQDVEVHFTGYTVMGTFHDIYFRFDTSMPFDLTNPDQYMVQLGPNSIGDTFEYTIPLHVPDDATCLDVYIRTHTFSALRLTSGSWIGDFEGGVVVAPPLRMRQRDDGAGPGGGSRLPIGGRSPGATSFQANNGRLPVRTYT